MPTSSTIDVKKLQVKPITATLGNILFKRWHYSGKVVPNSQLHFGVFLDKEPLGVMQFGPSINKKGTINLVSGTQWNGFIELNRMAFSPVLPKNSESRALSVALRLIKKNCPFIDWVITFADGCQSGTGTIYRATGFKLLEICKNEALRINPKTGEPMYTIQAHHLKISKEFSRWQPLVGYQLKYIYFLNKEKEKNLTIKPLDYKTIEQYSFPANVKNVRA